MDIRGVCGIAALSFVLAGCTGTTEAPSPSPTTTTVPTEIEEFLDAAIAGDVETVRARLSLYNAEAGRELKPQEISLECAEDEAAYVGPLASRAETIYVNTEYGEPWVLTVVAPSGGQYEWGIEEHEDGWYVQPQQESCLALESSPSPEPSPS